MADDIHDPDPGWERYATHWEPEKTNPPVKKHLDCLGIAVIPLFFVCMITLLIYADMELLWSLESIILKLLELIQ